MKAWRLEQGFGLDNLRLVQVPDPVAGPGEVVVRQRAVSLNARDLMMVLGQYNRRQPLPLVPCSDSCGEVVALGAGVERLGLGDRVIPTFAPSWIAGEPTRDLVRATRGGPLPGTLCELFLASADALVLAPRRHSDIEAATLPCAGLTAWTALVVDGAISPGERVLVIGSGGVSLFALQIAKAAGAWVVAITRSAAKAQRLAAAGADLVLTSDTTPEWGAAVREATAGQGVDHVVEVGGAGTLEQSLAATRVGGHVALIGVLAGASAPLRLTDIFMKRLRVQGVLVGDRNGLEALARAAQSVLPPPVIHHVFDFAEAPAAFEHLASGSHFGKIAIQIE